MKCSFCLKNLVIVRRQFDKLLGQAGQKSREGWGNNIMEFICLELIFRGLKALLQSLLGSIIRYNVSSIQPAQDRGYNFNNKNLHVIKLKHMGTLNSGGVQYCSRFDQCVASNNSVNTVQYSTTEEAAFSVSAMTSHNSR